MAKQKNPVLVVVQLTGGNDYLNTVVPYNNPLYRDNRKAVSIGEALRVSAGRGSVGHDAISDTVAVVAVFLGTLNVVGGFVVTDRMLEMFKGRGAQIRKQRDAA